MAKSKQLKHAWKVKHFAVKNSAGVRGGSMGPSKNIFFWSAKNNDIMI